MAPNRWWTLTVVSVGSFMLLLDVTIVNIALPDIEEALDATLTDLQWVVAAYAVALSAALLTAGSLADRFGRRAVFSWGMGIFTLASLLCGIAQDPLTLIAARVLQGVGGAALLATSLALLAAAYPDHRDRHVALAVWGAVSGAALAVGPLAGGVLVEATGWRWIFLVNLPVGVLALLATALRVAESRAESAGRIDWPGFLTFGTALGALSFALLRANEEGWSSTQVVSGFVLSAVSLAAFVLVERARRDPMLPGALFRKLTTTGAAVGVLAMSSTAFALLLYLTLYLQTVLGHEPLAAGLRLLPLTLSIFAASAIAARLGTVLPARWLVSAGLACIGAGLLLMGGLDASDDWTALLAGQLVTGLGVGLVNPNVVAAAMGAVEPARVGVASGLSNTCRSLGIAVGIASLGAVFADRVRDAVHEALAGTPLQERAGELGHAVSSGQIGPALAELPPQQRGIFTDAAHSAFVDGLNSILTVAAVVAFVGALAVIPLIRSRDLATTAPDGEPLPIAAGH
ncbi:MFS transporter [Streptomyces sp. V4I2]|uniref:MFS transporter n=1 Tax=Streptomyces sp. V4I2 TaxID=3042280 RepID=UPI002787745F|nr:MFS transporter [Streptomyces sp. V4I2]MDQ1045421.1 EmrB/QacA subfamily drug resistance transporter [Streptomyces sp. V4I2]